MALGNLEHSGDVKIIDSWYGNNENRKLKNLKMVYHANEQEMETLNDLVMGLIFPHGD